ncbi:GNAT family N-acetyltransferase [Rathayibacter oskolensis]|nr:GNAT family N-acetyltransferase [Rathayibacter oskolensis]
MAGTGSAARPREVDGTEWYGAAERELAARMGVGSLAAFVVDDPDSRSPRLIGCAVAQLIGRLPGPGFSTGLSGELSSVYVELPHRGVGRGTELVRAALHWFDLTGCEVVDLHATPDSERIYRALGFEPPASSALRRLHPDLAR